MRVRGEDQDRFDRLWQTAPAFPPLPPSMAVATRTESSKAQIIDSCGAFVGKPQGVAAGFSTKWSPRDTRLFVLISLFLSCPNGCSGGSEQNLLCSAN